jgi:plastocyanin
MKTLIVVITVMSLAWLAGAVRGVTVRMTSRHAFVPKTLTIKVGDTVVWDNDSPGVHTVTDNSAFASAKQDASMPAGTEPFNSGPVEAGQHYLHTFTAPGTYKYFCVPHEADGMVGTIIVTK